MVAPSLIRAAKQAPDRLERIHRLAAVLVELDAGPSSALYKHVYAKGFTEAEVIAYGDAARGVIENRPTAMRFTAPHVKECAAFAQAAQAIKRIKTAPSWAKPVVTEAEPIVWGAPLAASASGAGHG